MAAPSKPQTKIGKKETFWHQRDSAGIFAASASENVDANDCDQVIADWSVSDVCVCEYVQYGLRLFLCFRGGATFKWLIIISARDKERPSKVKDAYPKFRLPFVYNNRATQSSNQYIKLRAHIRPIWYENNTLSWSWHSISSPLPHRALFLPKWIPSIRQKIRKNAWKRADINDDDNVSRMTNGDYSFKTELDESK